MTSRVKCCFLDGCAVGGYIVAVFADFLQVVLVEPPWSPVFELIMQFSMKHRIFFPFYS